MTLSGSKSLAILGCLVVLCNLALLQKAEALEVGTVSGLSSQEQIRSRPTKNNGYQHKNNGHHYNLEKRAENYAPGYPAGLHDNLENLGKRSPSAEEHIRSRPPKNGHHYNLERRSPDLGLVEDSGTRIKVGRHDIIERRSPHDKIRTRQNNVHLEKRAEGPPAPAGLHNNLGGQHFPPSAHDELDKRYDHNLHMPPAFHNERLDKRTENYAPGHPAGLHGTLKG